MLGLAEQIQCHEVFFFSCCLRLASFLLLNFTIVLVLSFFNLITGLHICLIDLIFIFNEYIAHSFLQSCVNRRGGYSTNCKEEGIPRTADLVTFTEETLNGKLHCLCSDMFPIYTHEGSFMYPQLL